MALGFFMVPPGYTEVFYSATDFAIGSPDDDIVIGSAKVALPSPG
jgi:hypothetical protein